MKMFFSFSFHFCFLKELDTKDLDQPATYLMKRTLLKRKRGTKKVQAWESRDTPGRTWRRCSRTSAGCTRATRRERERVRSPYLDILSPECTRSSDVGSPWKKLPKGRASIPIGLRPSSIICRGAKRAGVLFHRREAEAPPSPLIL